MKSPGVNRANADFAKCGFAERKFSGWQSMLVKLQRPPPEIRIFFPTRSARSSTATRRPRLPASAAQKRPAAPAPTTTTSKRRLIDSTFRNAKRHYCRFSCRMLLKISQLLKLRGVRRQKRGWGFLWRKIAPAEGLGKGEKLPNRIAQEGAGNRPPTIPTGNRQRRSQSDRRAVRPDRAGSLVRALRE